MKELLRRLKLCIAVLFSPMGEGKVVIAKQHTPCLPPVMDYGGGVILTPLHGLGEKPRETQTFLHL